MKRFIVLVLMGFLAWQGYLKYQSSRPQGSANQGIADVVQTSSPTIEKKDDLLTTQFKCDGRTYCSQMNSCAEATFFLKHCPDVKMDGNNDGVPCEQQWCK